ILQAILQKAAEFGPVRVKLAIFGQEVAAQDETLLMALEFTGMEPIAVAQRMSGRLLKGRSDAVLITRALKLLYKERQDIDYWFIVSGDRDLNALCKAIKDEDKHVYLIAGDKSLANELRDSPYLRDDVFLLEDLIPQARWTRAALRADDTQVDKPQPTAELARRTPQRRGRLPARVRTEPHVPAVVPTASPESDKEQRRLAVLLLDQLVALHARAMARGDFVTSVVPLSQKEASSVLEQRIDAGIEQRTVVAKLEGRARAKATRSSCTHVSPPHPSFISSTSSHRRAPRASASTGSTRPSSPSSCRGSRVTRSSRRCDARSNEASCARRSMGRRLGSSSIRRMKRCARSSASSIG